MKKQAPIKTLEEKVNCMNPVCDKEIQEGDVVLYSIADYFVHKGFCYNIMESTGTVLLMGTHEVRIQYK